MAAAAKLIEDYFRDIENDVLVQDPVCGRMIADIAEAFPDAIDQELEGEPESLNACVATMRSYLDGTPREPDPGGGPGNHPMRKRRPRLLMRLMSPLPRRTHRAPRTRNWLRRQMLLNSCARTSIRYRISAASSRPLGQTWKVSQLGSIRPASTN